MAETGPALARRMRWVPDRAKLHIAMNVSQFGYAGNHVILRTALNMGISKLVFPAYRNIIALAMIAPFAYFLEKKDRPALTASFLVQFFLLAFVGITANQGFYLLGLDNTSPTLASATENAVPAVTFLMAAILRIEEVHLNRRDGKAKVLGTICSVAGASIITIYKGPIIFRPSHPLNQSLPSISLGDAEGKNWTLGCVYLIGHCICWSGWIVLQAPILKKYPAQLSISSFTCFFAILQFLAVAGLIERNSQAWLFHSRTELFCVLYSGAVVSGIGFSIQLWAVGKAGPVFVSAYLPLQTLLVAVMASLALGERFYLGGVLGAVLILVGLYLVVWGKSEEGKFATRKAVIPSVAESSPSTNNGKSSIFQPLLPTSSR